MKNSLNGKTYDTFTPIFVGGRWIVIGENVDGYRIMSLHSFEDQVEATNKASIFTQINNDGNLDMRWFEEVDPVYGSRAHIIMEIEQMNSVATTSGSHE